MPEIKPNDHIVVHFIESQPLGLRFKRSRNGWPLHVTLAKWFGTESMRQVEAGLQVIAGSTGNFDVTVGEERMFGPQGDTKVNVIADQDRIRGLHRSIVDVIRKYDGVFMNDLWMGDEYQAHVTHHENARCHEYDKILINGFHLVKMADEQDCEVVAFYPLEGDNL